MMDFPEQKAVEFWLNELPPREQGHYAVWWTRWTQLAPLILHYEIFEGRDEGWLQIGRFTNEAGQDVVEML